jgi:hypothetical protein
VPQRRGALAATGMFHSNIPPFGSASGMEVVRIERAPGPLTDI